MRQPIWELEDGELWPRPPEDPQRKPYVPDGVKFFSLEQAAAFMGKPVQLLRRQWKQLFNGILPEDEPLLVDPTTADRIVETVAAESADDGERRRVEPDPKSPEGIRARLAAAVDTPTQVLWRAWQYPHLDDDNWALFKSLCDAHGLNECSNQVFADFVHDEKTGLPKLVLIVGIAGIRMMAHRTGQRAGASKAIYEPPDVPFPDRCSVTVYRYSANGEKIAFVGEAEASEYVGVGLSDYANRMPKHRLKKCAEAQGYRQAFPEIGDVYTPEEIESVREQHHGPSQARPAQSAGRDGIDAYLDDEPAIPLHRDAGRVAASPSRPVAAAR